MAEQTIKKFGKEYRNYLLSSEDGISYVAHYIMTADLKWDSSAAMSRKSWRIQHGRYGIAKFLEQARRTNKYANCPSELPEFKKNSESAIDSIIKQENQEKFLEEFNKLGLSEREKFVITEKLSGRTLVSIATDFNISKQAVWQIYQRAIQKVKNGKEQLYRHTC